MSHTQMLDDDRQLQQTGKSVRENEPSLQLNLSVYVGF